MWSVYGIPNNNLIQPLKYEDGKTQEDSVKEIIEAFKTHDIVLFLGFPGSGKSMVALSVIKEMGKGIISVPTKPLQKQYEESYTRKGKYWIKMKDGMPMKIDFVVGRGNFKCSFMTKERANSFKIPCKRILEEGEKRFVVGKECPHFSPRYADSDYIEVISNYLRPCTAIKYGAVSGEWYAFSRDPCDYYKQINDSLDSDAIVMNYANWEIDTIMGRKPRRDVEVLDEYDDYFDGLITEISLSHKFFDIMIPEEKAKKNPILYEISKRKIRWLTELNSIITKAGDNEIKHDTSLYNIVMEFFEEMMFEMDNLYKVTSDENYMQKADKMKFMLNHFNSCFIKVKRDSLNIVFPYPDIMLRRLLANSSKKILLMSGTSHSDFVFQQLFGVVPYKVYGRQKSLGKLILHNSFERLNLEERYWKIEAIQWEYWKTVKAILKSVDGQTLVISHARKFIEKLGIPIDDAEHNLMDDFLQGKFKQMASLRAKRGIDLPGELCRNVIIPKIPNKDLSSPSIRALQHRFTPPSVFWAIYRDMSTRNFIQEICRALRKEDDTKNYYIIDKTAYERVKSLGVFDVVET